MPNVAPPPYDHDHENEVTLFAKTNFRNQQKTFGIKTDDRRRHVYVIGKTGMGKTTLLENMVLADIYAGHGVAYIDPHGDTAANLLDFIPANRINDVVYVNPADMQHPIGFNILETVDDSKKHLVSAGLMGVFKKIWPDVWSARMEYILLNSILALLDSPGSTLLGINRLLVDEEYRKRVVSVIQDPVVKTFWVKEFAAFSEKYRTEAIAPVQNKVGQFLSAAIIRNIVAQVKSTIDLREIMDQRKILIVNLSKGAIGEENMRLLGGMIVTRLTLAAMERVDMKEKDRQDFYLYVDEFQNFATESFANILSEARKYRLNLTVAHQYIEQLAEEVAAAIFGNVGTMIAFRVGSPDAEKLETEFTPRFTQEDLVNLAKYDIYLKLMINGAASEPFSATTLAPIAQRTGNADKVIKVSRERYSSTKASIEDKVLRWSGIGTTDEGATITTEEEAESKEATEKLKQLERSSPNVGEMAVPADGGFGAKKKKPVVAEIPCSVCGKVQQLSFEPDRSRPWFCKEDLEKRRIDMESKRAMPPVAPPARSERPPRPPERPLRPAAPTVAPRAAERPPRPMEPKRQEPKPDLRAAKPVVKVDEAVKPVSLSALLGKTISDSEEMEVIVEDDGPEEGSEVAEPAEPEARPKGLVDFSATSERPRPATKGEAPARRESSAVPSPEERAPSVPGGAAPRVEKSASPKHPQSRDRDRHGRGPARDDAHRGGAAGDRRPPAAAHPQEKAPRPVTAPAETPRPASPAKGPHVGRSETGSGGASPAAPGMPPQGQKSEGGEGPVTKKDPGSGASPLKPGQVIKF